MDVNVGARAVGFSKKAGCCTNLERSSKNTVVLARRMLLATFSIYCRLRVAFPSKISSNKTQSTLTSSFQTLGVVSVNVISTGRQPTLVRTENTKIILPHMYRRNSRTIYQRCQDLPSSCQKCEASLRKRYWEAKTLCLHPLSRATATRQQYRRAVPSATDGDRHHRRHHHQRRRLQRLTGKKCFGQKTSLGLSPPVILRPSIGQDPLISSRFPACVSRRALSSNKCMYDISSE